MKLAASDDMDAPRVVQLSQSVGPVPRAFKRVCAALKGRVKREEQFGRMWSSALCPPALGAAMLQ